MQRSGIQPKQELQESFMGVSHHFDKNRNEVIIRVTDRFDFSCQKEFRTAYQNYPKGGRYIIDLSQVDYMDSSALGMLLMLREHASSSKENLVLRSVNPTLMKILTIANFGRMFTFD